MPAYAYLGQATAKDQPARPATLIARWRAQMRIEGRSSYSARTSRAHPAGLSDDLIPLLCKILSAKEFSDDVLRVPMLPIDGVIHLPHLGIGDGVRQCIEDLA